MPANGLTCGGRVRSVAVKRGPPQVFIAALLSAAATQPKTAWDQFVEIISKPDNMPVAGALLLVVFFTWISMREALRNDRLIREKRKDEIITRMQE
jgi:hypothetical protein